MTGLPVLGTFLTDGAIAAVEGLSTFGRRDARETLREYLRRIEHELLWPRILVRNASPPRGEIQPNAPDRPAKRSGRRPSFRA